MIIPSIATDGFGVVLLFAVGNFFGFEATVIYREEVRDPQKTIPRATFIAVLGIGSFYFLAAWGFLSFYGSDNVAAALSENAATSFMDILATLNTTFADIISCLIVTSLLASQLSIQNVATRYLYSLGRDRVFPSFLGKVHKKHFSPFTAATTVGVVWAIILTIFLPTGKEAGYLYALFAGLGEYFLVMIVFMASIAIIAYFRKNPQFNFSLWTTLIAPTLAAIGVAFVLVKAVLNFNALTGETGKVSVFIFTGILLIAIAGYTYASYLKKAKPEVYASIGRQEYTD
jgi:amino acid transporter